MADSCERKCLYCSTIFELDEVDSGIFACRGRCQKLYRKNNMASPKSNVLPWAKGDFCRAVFTEDDLEYEGIIQSVSATDDGTPYFEVKYLGYGNVESKWLQDLMKSRGKAAQKAQLEAAKADGFPVDEAEISEELNPDVQEFVPNEYASKDSNGVSVASKGIEMSKELSTAEQSPNFNAEAQNVIEIPKTKVSQQETSERVSKISHEIELANKDAQIADMKVQLKKAFAELSISSSQKQDIEVQMNKTQVQMKKTQALLDKSKNDNAALLAMIEKLKKEKEQNSNHIGDRPSNDGVPRASMSVKDQIFTVMSASGQSGAGRNGVLIGFANVPEPQNWRIYPIPSAEQVSCESCYGDNGVKAGPTPKKPLRRPSDVN